jgi:uncharacterized membrane protein (UPF0127 family)
MAIAHIQNADRLDTHPIRAIYCSTFRCQLRGLMFRRSIAAYDGLLLVQRGDSMINAAIHMLGMNFDLCVVWINSDYQVVDVRHAKRWHPAYFPKAPARFILEAHLDRINDYFVGESIEITLLPDH